MSDIDKLGRLAGDYAYEAGRLKSRNAWLSLKLEHAVAIADARSCACTTNCRCNELASLTLGEWRFALARNIAQAAQAQYAFNLGQRAVELAHVDVWFPGEGIASTQAVLSCEWCGTNYAGSPQTRQALDCAASTRQRADGTWVLTGHYGSRRHDMNQYEWRDYPTWLEQRALDPICDRCIDKLIAEGQLALISENML